MKSRWVVIAALATAMGCSTVTASAVSPAIVPAAVETRISAHMPTTIEAGRLLTVVGAVKPADPGVPVQLWQLRKLAGRMQWLAVAETAQRADGSFTLRMRAGPRGSNVYRAATFAAGPRTNPASVPMVVTTHPPSTPGIRATRLADTTPLWAWRSLTPDPPVYATGSSLINGRRYPGSVRASSDQLRYELGADASTFGAAIALAPASRGPVLHKGPRLVEIKVDHVVRVRRFVRAGQAFPVRIDVRGKRFVDVVSHTYGTRRDGALPGSDLILGTPVVTSEVMSERGVEASTLLDNLRPIGPSPINIGHVHGDASREIFGGSLVHFAFPTGSSTGSISYSLAGAYTRFTGIPGIFGETTSGLVGRVRVFGDDRLLAELPAPIWSHDRASVDVTGVRRLRIDLVATVPSGMSHSRLWFVVWGDGRLT